MLLSMNSFLPYYSPSKGMLEMVQNSKALSGVKSIRAFLKENHPDSRSELGIDPVVMDTYVRSCAGYAVITYLLGIGDRHLDNIMIDVLNDHVKFIYRKMVISIILISVIFSVRILR